MRLNGRTSLILVFCVAQTSMIALAHSDFDDPYCDNFCGVLVDGKSDKVLGLNGQDGWTLADDVACKTYLSTVTTTITLNGVSVAPSPTPMPLPTPWPSTAAQQAQCQWHAGQALQQCMSYEAAHMSAGLQKTMIVLDIVGSGMCWAACVNPLVPEIRPLCSAAGITADVADLIGDMKMSSSPVGKAVGSVLAVGDLAINAFEAGSMLKNANQEMGKRDRTLTCESAAAMTAMIGVRSKELASNGETKQQACTQIHALAGNTPPVSGTSTAVGSINTNLNAVNTATGGVPAGTNGSLTSGNAPNIISCAKYGLGSQPGGCGMSSSQLSSPDAALLNTQLGQAVAQQAIPNYGQIVAQLNSGASPGALARGALGGDASNELGSAVETLASAAAAHPPQAPSAPNAVAAGGAAKKTSDDSAFKFDFSDTQAAQGAPEAAYSQATRAPAASEDIFHTGYKGSIFDIVTQKISATQDRVDKMEWSTRLNRALNGLPTSNTSP
jgi:hypothetical protein